MLRNVTVGPLVLFGSNPDCDGLIDNFDEGRPVTELSRINNIGLADSDWRSDGSGLLIVNESLDSALSRLPPVQLIRKQISAAAG